VVPLRPVARLSSSSFTADELMSIPKIVAFFPLRKNMTPLRSPPFVPFACNFSLTSAYNYIAAGSFFGKGFFVKAVKATCLIYDTDPSREDPVAPAPAAP
jgi:hypothetical protein